MKKLLMLSLSIAICSTAFCAPAIIKKNDAKKGKATAEKNVKPSLPNTQFCAEVSAMHCGREMCLYLCGATRADFNDNYAFFVAACNGMACD